MRIFASVAYKGTHYYGWQKQPNVITVQEVIEDRLSQYFNRPITIYGAGRTDAGVHAYGQKFHFDIDADMIDLDRLLYSINKMLPEDIRIDDFIDVDDDFHSRFSAKAKYYSYAILPYAKDPFLYETTYCYPHPIDAKELQEILTHFIGKHNFKNFTSKEEDEDNFVREIFSIDVKENNEVIYIFFKGSGFMRYMIRFIVGTALDVLNKKLTVEEVDYLLDDLTIRQIVSSKAPAQGLTLIDVEY